MLRIFGHFFPIPTLVLGFVEAALLTCAIYLITAPSAPAQIANGLPVAAQFAMAVTAFAMVAMIAVGLYNSDVFLDYRVLVIRMLLAVVLIAPLAFLVALFFHDEIGVGAGLRSLWYIKAALAWLASLLFTRTVFLHVSALEIFKRRILVIGSGQRAARLKEMGGNRPGARFVPVAFINACGDPRVVECMEPFLDKTNDGEAALRTARELKVQEIVIATEDRRGLPVGQFIQCKLAGINVIDYSSFCERETGRVDLNALQPSWFIFSDGFRMGTMAEFVKRGFDLVVGSVILVLVMPVMATAALAIRLDSSGPVLYRQERVGLRGCKFVLLKFRSMRVDAERDGAPRWAQKNDPRMTRIGGFIRKVRIDELPQLFNVLRGDMSFIGPRPERPFFVDQIAQTVPFYRERHAIRPGITGWAQINYPYGASLMDARHKLSYDLYYLKNCGIFLDLVILIQTVRVIIWPTGAR